MTLEDQICQAMSGTDPIIALNLFMTSDGKFQANVGRREHGAYKVAQAVSPVKAIEAAFRAASQPVAAPVAQIDEFDELLG